MQIYEAANIRLTKHVKSWLTNKAKENCRSLSGEIQYRLEKQMEEERNAEKPNTN